MRTLRQPWKVGGVDMSGVTPWQMWGNTQTINLVATFPAQAHSTQQLARVKYGRPDSWKFLFAAKVIQVDPAAGFLDIYFNLTVGIGRSQITLPIFEAYDLAWPLGSPPNGQLFYSTSVNGPQRVFPPVPPSPPGPAHEAIPQNVISEIVAQDIQLNCDVYYNSVAGSKLTVQVDAYFSPVSHIRPEWFARQFRGDEDQGS